MKNWSPSGKIEKNTRSINTQRKCVVEKESELASDIQWESTKKDVSAGRGPGKSPVVWLCQKKMQASLEKPRGLIRELIKEAYY